MASGKAERVGPRARWQEFPIRIRELEVLRVARVTPRMVRVTLGGPEHLGFESHVPDEHVKIVFPDPETGELRVPTPDGDHLDWPRPFPTTREYTVRRYDADAGELDLDFVVHPGGLASDWATAVQPGARIHIAGPPSGIVVPPDFDFYLLIGDETALPAIARWASELPRAARGAVLLEVESPAEQQPIDAPDGVAVTWLFRTGLTPGQPAGTTGLLDRHAREIDIPAGATVYACVAGEAGSIKPLRSWLRKDLGLDKYTSSITGYWKLGRADTHEHLDEEEDDPRDELSEQG